ncbi:MAG: aminotransferase class I/II-fold pyridoxal phosphate-dependent enzyme [Lachnospiraceae bacterium]|nr:aminotransferase class I/II-fold pyridoxal phosphate-dependent enzyme [Lachnospiraceae bacterium]
MHGGDIYRNRVRLDYSVSLNPLGAPEEVRRALEGSLERLGEYPDPAQDAVRFAISGLERIPAERIIAGNGASELLMAAVRAIAPRRVLLFEPGYTGYAHALHAANCEICTLTLAEGSGFALTAEALAEMDRVRPDVVLIGDPVNPTGRNQEDGLLSALIDRAGQIGCSVILDESFFLLSDKAAREEDVAHRLPENGDHLLLLRSLTKVLAMPGIRMGYLISSERRIREIRAQLPEWNLPVTAEEAICAGCEVLARGAYLSRTRETIRTERAFLSDLLASAGCGVFAGETCFLLFTGPAGLGEALLKKGILIRDCNDFTGLRPGFFRIAVRGHADNLLFAEAFREVMHEF